MIKNNKGFMLIEVIVTSTIVVTTMIALYTGFNKLYNDHKTRNSYYNLDATYATKEMINSMLVKNKGNINEFINVVMHNSTYGHIVKENTCINEIDFGGDVGKKAIDTVTSCPNIQSLYSIENMILSEYDSNSLNKLKGEVKQTFKEYIDYIINYYDIPSDLDVVAQEEKYSYIMLTETKENDNYYYASLRVR